MRHIFGMAKRSLDLKGAKGPKVELDYLRLVYAVKEFRGRGSEAKGYFLVMTPEIARRVTVWQQKYQADDTVLVGVAELTVEEVAALEAEIEANTAGMVAGVLGEEVAGRSDASTGGNFGEQKLKLLIEKHETDVAPSQAGTFPFDIRWDFYGTRNQSSLTMAANQS